MVQQIAIATPEYWEMIRQIVREEIKAATEKTEDKLLSPAETCKLFNPSISKATLYSWTKQDRLKEYRIGGRVYYKQSEVLEAVKHLQKYKVR